MEMPPQVGQILFEGRQAIQFWVRAFQLEKEIEMVRQMVEATPDHKWAASPIVQEYRVSDQLIFIYLIMVDIDSLGISDGVGAVYWADPEHEAKVYQARDRHADHMLEIMRKKVPVHAVAVTEGGRET